jgi:hypothetical protein
MVSPSIQEANDLKAVKNATSIVVTVLALPLLQVQRWSRMLYAYLQVQEFYYYLNDNKNRWRDMYEKNAIDISH